MTRVKNISKGQRGIRLADGSLLNLEPGQVSDDVKLAEGEQADGEETSWFAFDDAIVDGDQSEAGDPVQAARSEVAAAAREALEAMEDRHAAELEAKDARIAELEAKLGGSTDDLPALSGKNKGDLLEIAAKERVTVDETMKVEDIKAAIEAHRAL